MFSHAHLVSEGITGVEFLVAIEIPHGLEERYERRSEVYHWGRKNILQ